MYKEGLFVVLNVFDYVLTVLLYNNPLIQEINPIMDYLFSAGYIYPAMVKAVGTLLILLLIINIKSLNKTVGTYLIGFLCVGYLIIVCNNFYWYVML